MRKPFLTFVIPAYNEEKVIGACLDSVIAECERINTVECEIIVVDNASTDATSRIAASYENVTVVHEERKGLVWARRAGHEHAAADIVANIDADTRLPEGWLSQVVEYFSSDDHGVVLTGPHYYYDGSFFTRVSAWLYYRCIVYPTYLVNTFILRSGSMVQGGNFVVTKQAIDDIGGYDPEQFEFYGEDADLARRLHAVGKIKFDLSFRMYTSARRFQEEGLVRTGIRYTVNYLSVMFLKKPASQQHKDIRDQ